MTEKRPSLTGLTVLFTFGRMLMNVQMRMFYPFLRVFARGLNLPETAITQALGVRSLMGLISPFLASITDRGGRKLGMLLGLGLFAVVNTLVVIFPTFPMLVAAMLGTMLAMFIYLPAVQSYLGDRVAYQQRGRLLAVVELGWSISFFVGIPVVGWLIAWRGWVAPFPLLAGLGGVAFLLVALRVENVRSSTQNQGGQAALRQVFTHPPALAGLLMGLCFASANEMVNIVFGVWLQDSFQLSILGVGLTAAVIGIAELCGESLSVWLVDRLGKTRAVASGIGLNCLVALLLVVLGQSLAGGVVGLFMFFITFEFAVVCSFPMMTGVLPQARATLMGSYLAMFALGRGFAALAGPWLYQRGFWLNAVAALLLDLLAMAALRGVRVQDVEKG
jgi:predicted MFS family arabinose efflux permease